MLRRFTLFGAALLCLALFGAVWRCLALLGAADDAELARLGDQELMRGIVVAHDTNQQAERLRIADFSGYEDPQPGRSPGPKAERLWI